MIEDVLRHDRAALESAARRMCQTAQLGEGELVCRVLGKYIMYVDPRDRGITPHLALNGFWEAWITLALARTIQPGWRCIDVGANVGYFTLLMADAVGSAGHVLALEPNPAIARWLHRNVSVNGFRDFVDIQVAAAADCDGSRVDLTVDPSDPGLATICRNSGRPGETVAAVTATIDRLTGEWPTVDLMKIDAEGAEPAIWQGMRRTLERNPRIVVLMEFTPSLYEDPLAFLAQIRAEGFSVGQITADAVVVPLQSDSIQDVESTAGSIMLFLARQ